MKLFFTLHKNTPINIKRFIFLLLFVWLSANLSAQCPQENMFYLSTQEEVDNFSTLYPGCTQIENSLWIGKGGNQFSYITDLSPVSQITSVNGDLRISGNYSLDDLTDLENLVSVGGTVTVARNRKFVNLTGLNNLSSVGENVVISDSENVVNLQGLEGLTTIEGYLLIAANSGLVSLEGIENLTSVTELDIRSNDNLTSISDLQNLTSLGDLAIGYNDSLINLNGLENITSLGALDISENLSLNDISGLENVTSMENLRIADNPTLNDLEALSNLSSIDYYLSIYNNDALTNLSGLENVTSIGGDLSILNNENLININSIRNIDYESITRMFISDNPNLSVCSTPTVCLYIQNDRFTNIADNAIGCSSNDEILGLCSPTTKIKTDVFYDSNQNKIQDGNEIDYYDCSILIEPQGNLYYAQSNGLFYVESGNYTAIFDETNNQNWELTTDSTSYFLSIEEGQTDIVTVRFGIYPTQEISSIQTIINSPPARCNETITLNVTTKNLGTTVASGIMWLEIDDAITAFNFINEPDTLVAGFDTYGWYYTDLYPGQTIIKSVSVSIPGPPDFELGEQLLFNSFSEYTDANGDNASEGFRYNPEVRCSYDPNDKLVNPNREGDYVLFDEDLIYTIRFQNTGNDVAYDVVIRDTLDTNLDFSTFRLLGSSHADILNTTLSEERVLTFEFRDIFLPDSTSNFEASQGYVTYRIHTIDGLAEETPVTNSAGIYFDLNPPVITNTTQSVIVSELPTIATETPDNSFDFNILPNPNTGIFTVQGIPEGTYQILSTSGQIIQQGEMKNDMSVDISDVAQGVYFISVTTGNDAFVRRVVKM